MLCLWQRALPSWWVLSWWALMMACLDYHCSMMLRYLHIIYIILIISLLLYLYTYTYIYDLCCWKIRTRHPHSMLTGWNAHLDKTTVGKDWVSRERVCGSGKIYDKYKTATRQLLLTCFDWPVACVFGTSPFLTTLFTMNYCNYTVLVLDPC